MRQDISQRIVSLTALFIVIGVVSFSFSYWSGMLTENLGQKYERLEITGISFSGIDSLTSQEVYKLTVKNTGTADSKLEYLFVNGSLISYGSEVFGIFREYNVGEYKLIPWEGQTEVYFLYEAAGRTRFEVRLHTLAGGDFIQVLTLSRT